MSHPEGIVGARTRAAFAARVYATVEAILDRPSERQVIVTHGATLTFVVACWTRMPIDSTGHVAIRSMSGGITSLRRTASTTAGESCD